MKHRLTPACAAIAIVLSGAASADDAALPQAAPTPGTSAETQAQDLDTVTVTGGRYSRSLERAVDLKLSSVGFTDSIVATDVADFPEQNLSEALQRMPGVTIERNKGLGSKVNVRGLPSDYTHVSINDLATASGSGGRDVEFDIFASEIIQQVTVQKSPTAADEEGAIAGSVKISTARPFDYPERKLVVSAEGAYNTISEETDPKIAFLASNTWGHWGALVSYSKARRTNRTDSTANINFRPLTRFLGVRGTRGEQAQEVFERDTGILINDRTDSAETDHFVFPHKVDDRIYLNDQEKWGGTLSLQYQPSRNFNLSLDAMIGGFDATEDEYAAGGYSASSRSTLGTIHEYDAETFSEYGIVVLKDVSYTATQHDILSKERVNETDYKQYSVSFDWKGDDWTLHGLAGYSGAEKSMGYSNLKHVAYAPSRTRWTAQGGETISSDHPDTIDMYNAPERYLFEAYETRLEHIIDDKYAAQLNFRKSLDLAFFPTLTHIEVGARYTDRSNERRFGEIEIQGPGAGDSSWVDTRTLMDGDLRPITDIVPGRRYRVKDITWSQMSNAWARDTMRYPGFFTPFDDGQYYRVDEDVTSIYAMMDLYFNIARIPVTLNLGTRYASTSVLSFGYHPIQNPDGSLGYDEDPVSMNGSYHNLLPSLNASAELADGLHLRAAASKTLIRPTLTDIAYRRSTSRGTFRYLDGNPDLQPTTARQWEIGLEKYLDNGGLLAASYFYKKIDGVVITSLTGVVRDVPYYNNNGTLNGIYDFDVYQPVNASGSYEVDGLELIAQLPLTVIHPALEGFGVSLNYTALDSSLAGESDLGVQTPMPGLSDKAYNLTVYYDNDRFDARLSWNYKSEYVESIGYNKYPIWRDAYGQLDMSISWRINEHTKISLKGINMTNEEAIGYTMDPKFPTMYELSGRRISLGLRMDF